MNVKPEKLTSATYPNDTSHTDIWRAFSWYLGDGHAGRLCKLLDFYCKIAGRPVTRFHHPMPR